MTLTVRSESRNKMAPPIRILIINPNTSTHMTDALKPMVHDLGHHAIQYTFFTSPKPGIPSINSPSDAEESASVCLPSLIELIPHHDCFLVACYSAHPLVPQLQQECEKAASKAMNGTDQASARKYVTGIFEASVLASLGILGPNNTQGFGIVSTGKIWEKALREAVDEFLGSSGAKSGSKRFLGCETTGLNASELHDLEPAVVRMKMKEATKRLIAEGKNQNIAVKAICLGCAGMVGLEEAVREASVEELGDAGKGMAIVDGVKAGVGILVGLARSGF